MNKINLIFVLLFAVIKNGLFAVVKNGLSTDNDFDIFLMGDNMDKSLIETLNSKLEQDIDLFKDLLPDPYEEVDKATKLILEQVISKEYAYMIANLAEDDDFLYMLKVAAIRSAVEAAFQKSIGKVEQRYVDELMNMIENEVQLYKQKLSLEQSGNKIR